MKKIIALILIILASCVGLVACNNASNVEDILRIHIRANSNSVEDQNVKYKVKEDVVAYLTPMIAGCESFENVVGVIRCNKGAIEDIADAVLNENGFDYRSSVEIREEYFPTRAYEGCTLEANFYDAIIINLGSGEGDNWWCVVYPPLCFKDTKNIVYKSKFKEIIDKYF